MLQCVLSVEFTILLFIRFLCMSHTRANTEISYSVWFNWNLAAVFFHQTPIPGSRNGLILCRWAAYFSSEESFSNKCICFFRFRFSQLSEFLRYLVLYLSVWFLHFPLQSFCLKTKKVWYHIVWLSVCSHLNHVFCLPKTVSLHALYWQTSNIEYHIVEEHAGQWHEDMIQRWLCM